MPKIAFWTQVKRKHNAFFSWKRIFLPSPQVPSKWPQAEGKKMGNTINDEVVSFAKASLCQTFLFLFLTKIGFLLNSYTSTTGGQILQIFNTKRHTFCTTSFYVALFKKYSSFKLQTPYITSSKPLIQEIYTEKKLRNLSQLLLCKLEHIWKYSCQWGFTFNSKQFYT